MVRRVTKLSLFKQKPDPMNQLLQSEIPTELSAKDREFRADLNQKLRAPLNAIIGFAELVAMRPGTPSKDADVQHIASSPLLLVADRAHPFIIDIEFRTLRTRARIRYPLWPPMHPAGLRCSSLTYSRYARSSRLAGRAPRRPERRPYFAAGP